MSNDLISRKAVIEAVDRHTRDDGTLDDDISVILEEVETSFDKEKVIEELRQEAMYELGIPEKKFNSDEGEYSSYCSISFSQAKRIAEKGGIE